MQFRKLRKQCLWTGFKILNSRMFSQYLVIHDHRIERLLCHRLVHVGTAWYVTKVSSALLSLIQLRQNPQLSQQQYFVFTSESVTTRSLMSAAGACASVVIFSCIPSDFNFLGINSHYFFDLIVLNNNFATSKS